MTSGCDWCDHVGVAGVIMHVTSECGRCDHVTSGCDRCDHVSVAGVIM